MKKKYLSTFLLLAMAAGCASDAPPEEAEMAQEEAAPAVASDADAIEAVRTYWAEHYNMGHGFSPPGIRIGSVSCHALVWTACAGPGTAAP